MKKIKIISIVGSGRSGSTILSLLLSQNRDVSNIGQLRDLWRAFNQDAQCTCSSSIRRCTFWGEVASKMCISNGYEGVLKFQSQNQAFIYDAKHLSDWTDGELINALKVKHHDFLENLHKLCSSCKTVAGVDALVDSSKSPEIALAFSMLDNVDLYVLNLVRDPRAVACSWEKKLQNRKKTIEYIKEWKRRQNILRNWLVVLKERYLYVSYEDFIKSPQKTVSDILSWAELNTNTGYFSSEYNASVSWVGQHMFLPSNEGVLSKKQTQIIIASPQEWKKIKYFFLHILAMFYTMPNSLVYLLNLKVPGCIKK